MARFLRFEYQQIDISKLKTIVSYSVKKWTCAFGNNDFVRGLHLSVRTHVIAQKGSNSRKWINKFIRGKFLSICRWSLKKSTDQ